MTYTRVTEIERSQIYALRQAGKGNNEIARIIGRDKGTVSREVRRNMGQKGYRHQQAHRKAGERAKRPGPRRFTEEVRRDVEEKLRKGWTPEIICGRAKLEGRAHVCKETVYKHVYEDAKAGGDLWERLPRAKRKRKRRCPRQEGRGRGVIPGRRGIETRPPEVELRITVGHWEGDLVVGANATGYLVTLVERVTRYTLVGWSATKEAEEVAAVVIGLLAAIGVACTGITFDNGKEFARHAEIAKALKADVFFARPYHSWERGTNENTNGLIRRLYPKSESFASIGGEDLRRIDTFLNDRPRKCLGWKTPREVMAAFLAAAA
ncbi:MAG TPA: IS30 family transposase [Candidatus Fermentibacter daniensis]|nr:IS30 family transposase [Candidatus Fermentibacter daniensis]